MFFDTRQKINPRRVILLVGDILSIAFSITLSACIRLSYYEGLAYVLEHIPTLAGSGLKSRHACGAPHRRPLVPRLFDR